MNQRTFSLTAVIIFLIIAILHALRIILSWEALVASWQVPDWISWAAFVVAAFMALAGFNLARKGPRRVK